MRVVPMAKIGIECIHGSDKDMSKQLTQEQFVEKARLVHGDKYDYSKSVYVTSKTPLEIICPIHGSFWQKPNKHISQKQGCPLCSKTHKLTQDEWIAKAVSVHGDRYDYSKVKYINADTKVEIVCNNCGNVFWQLAGNHLKGKGCPVCRYEFVRTSNPMKSEEAVQHLKQSMLQKYGTDNIAKSEYYKQKYPAIRKQRLNSLRKNKTFVTSKPEQIVYDKLCDIFGKDDVIKQYCSDVYPYLCDFYIKSRNLYIELNITWTHGGHWFDQNNIGDVSLMQKWIDKHTKYYDNAVSNWCNRDVKKRFFARRNCLNYLVFWQQDLSDFYEWVDTGCPDGTDWETIYSWKDN